MSAGHSKRARALGLGVLLCMNFLCAHASAAQRPACVPPRGHTAYKIESRCKALSFDARMRTYRLYVPNSIGPRSRKQALRKSPPVLLVLHGGGGSGSAMEALTRGRFNRAADRRHVLVAYPDGIDRGWNDGRAELRSTAGEEHIDDIGFLRAVIADIEKHVPVDRKRIYVTGISNGGMMAYRLACDAADFVAAAAPVAAGLSAELATECHPSRMVPIAIFNGTDDPIMPWLGGPIKGPWRRRGQVLSAEDTFEAWTKLGDCALPTTHMARNKVAHDGTSLVLHVARECQGDAEVRLYEILGGGHTWPGSTQYLPQRLVGKVSGELNASDEIWNFVSRFALQ